MKQEKDKSMAAKRPPAIKEKYTKSAIVASLSESTDLSKKQVTAVLDELSGLIERHLRRALQGIPLPGLMKIKSVKKPARKAKKGVPTLSNLVRRWT